MNDTRNNDLLAAKITVSDQGRERIRLNLPIGMVRLALQADFDRTLLSASDSLKDLDFSKIIELADEGKTGEVISYETEDHQKVSVTIG